MFDAQERLDRELMRRQVDVALSAGVHGLAALGLATEVAKLSEAERMTVMEWTAEDNRSRVPLAFTIFGASVAEQARQVRMAEDVGATWVILQPPMVGTFSAHEYIRFFGRVADATHLPVAIQNAPAYMGRGLSAEDMRDLIRQHPNVQLLKAEGSAVEIARLVEMMDGRVPVFNGRSGLELVDGLRAGCAGMILAPEVIDFSVRIYEAFRAGDEATADAQYARMLPAVTFFMQSIESFICYGKRLMAARADMTVHDRTPALSPTAFGTAIVARLAAELGPFGGTAGESGSR